jgi:hypothetical protein
MASTPRIILLPTPWMNVPLRDPIPGAIVEAVEVLTLVGAIGEAVTDAERGEGGLSRNRDWDMGLDDVDRGDSEKFA